MRSAADASPRQIGFCYAANWHTNHRAADFPAKEKWVRINEHRLQLPVGLAEDRKHFRVQIERILHDVVG